MNQPLVNTASSTDIYSESLRLALTGQLSIADLLSRAGLLKSLGQEAQSIELYKHWIAYNPGNELLHAAYFNFGVELNAFGDRAGAVNALRECVRRNADFYPAHINLGRVLEDSGLPGQAVAQWIEFANKLGHVNGSAVKHKIIALQQTGRVLEANHSPAAAEDALRQSMELRPDQPEAIQHYISLRQGQCKWPVITDSEFITKRQLQTDISPLSLANYTDDPMYQLAAAWRYGARSIGRPQTAPVATFSPKTRQRKDKLRIGYVSSDLREHAVGFAMTDVVETHNRQDFEIYAYYCGISRADATQARIKGAVDKWTDINGIADDVVARKILEDEIDILIDLNGYTKDARTKVFAHRPAPVQVNWFGFPNTMGTPYHHYIIADAMILPPEHEIYFSERVLRLPCYQPNDRKRKVAEHAPTRADENLPEKAFVYCSLNGTQKLTQRTFARWLNILEGAPNSVLWMLTGTKEANDRLRDIAAEKGVARDRLIFAEKKPNPEHLARYALADLFLDNLPYGAHTTAADSLWMGVPILTLPGRSFASRVCSSVVTAAGIGELVVSTPEAYVARAIEFGRDPKKLAPIKKKLIDGRDTSLLFDTPRLVGHLEDAYRQMWREFESGELPAPQLANLGTYHEIGAGLDLEDMDSLDDAAYRALYRKKLEDWDAIYPIAPDGRFWNGREE